MCSTGVAADASNNNVYCPLDVPAGAAVNGAGLYCYSSALDCFNGPNGCSTQSPCVQSDVCVTGQANASLTPWFCPAAMPVGAAPAPSGVLCFSSDVDCQKCGGPAARSAARLAASTVPAAAA